MKQVLEIALNFFNAHLDGNIIFQKASSYLNIYLNSITFGISKRYIVNVIIFVLSLYLLKRWRIEQSSALRCVNICIFIGILIESLAGNTLIVGRLTDFFLVLNVLSVINILNAFDYRNTIKLGALSNNSRDGVISELKMAEYIFVCVYIALNAIFFYRFIGF